MHRRETSIRVPSVFVSHPTCHRHIASANLERDEQGGFLKPDAWSATSGDQQQQSWATVCPVSQHYIEDSTTDFKDFQTRTKVSFWSFSHFFSKLNPLVSNDCASWYMVTFELCWVLKDSARTGHIFLHVCIMHINLLLYTFKTRVFQKPAGIS